MSAMGDTIYKEIYKEKFLDSMELLIKVCILSVVIFFIVFVSWVIPAFFHFLFTKNIYLNNEMKFFTILLMCICLLFLINLIVFYFRKINCGLEFDNYTFHIISYCRNKKIEKNLLIDDLEGILWSKHTRTYKDKQYREVTLITNNCKKISYIPIEIDSDIFKLIKNLILLVPEKSKQISHIDSQLTIPKIEKTTNYIGNIVEFSIFITIIEISFFNRALILIWKWFFLLALVCLGIFWIIKSLHK